MSTNRMLGATLAVFVGLCGYDLVLHMTGGGTPTLGELDAFERQAMPVIQALDAVFESTGRYPTDLSAAGIAVPDAGYGGWQYWAESDGSGCELSIGDYEINGKVLSWASREREWRIDS
ncbi:MAG: hypothetical protein H6825_03010 [Planctomycetes bacterium]|nr:hypothetical protein [Planctomycetota bacterium]